MSENTLLSSLLYRFCLVQKNINTTNRFSFCDFDIDYDHEIDDDAKKFDGIDEEFDLTSIVWGVGHYDMIGILWVDACSWFDFMIL